MTFGPALAFVPVVAAVYAWLGARAAWFLGAMTAGCFVGGGKLVIFAGAAKTAPLGVWPLAAVVIYGDIATALFMLANMHHLDRVRWVGPRLAMAHEAARGVLRANPWMRRLMWFGVATFVAVPFQGTGAVIGAVLGRVLGLTPAAIFAAIAAGTTGSAVLLALLGRLWRRRITWLVENPVIGVSVALVCLVATVWLGKWFMTRGSPKRHPNAP
jgi:uncharacterized membrane protein